MASEINLSAAASDISLRKQDLSEYVAQEVMVLFRWSLFLTGGIIVALCVLDELSMWYGIIAPEQRLVTEKVLLTLIGASVVQVGTASAAIVYSLFRRSGPAS